MNGTPKEQSGKRGADQYGPVYGLRPVRPQVDVHESAIPSWESGAATRANTVDVERAWRRTAEGVDGPQFQAQDSNHGALTCCVI